jgi:hypothetical protein
MDFNNIFNRAPSGGGDLGKLRAGYTVLEDWATFIDEILVMDRTVFVMDKARHMHKRLRERLRASTAASQYEHGIFKQSNKLDAHQTQKLLDELDAYVHSRVTPTAVTKAEADVLTNFLEDDVKETYDVTLGGLYQGVFDAEEQLRGVRRGAPSWTMIFEESSQSIADNYHRFNNDYPKTRARYEALKSNVKRQVPQHLHRFIDNTVELFVYQPYEIGILYIRRNHPGAIGTLNGLEE